MNNRKTTYSTFLYQQAEGQEERLVSTDGQDIHK